MNAEKECSAEAVSDDEMAVVCDHQGNITYRGDKMKTRSLLATKDWIWLVVIIAGASVANISGQFKMKDDLQTQMLKIKEDMNNQLLTLDRRWQDRQVDQAKSFRSDMAALVASMPPDWFKKMVEANRDELKDLRDRLNRIEASMIQKNSSSG